MEMSFSTRVQITREQVNGNRALIEKAKNVY